MSFNRETQHIDGLVDKYGDALISTSTKGFALDIEDGDGVVIPDKIHKKPKRNKRTRIFRETEFSNYGINNKNTCSQHCVILHTINMNKFLEELSFLGNIDFQKSSKTIKLGEKYFSKIKRKSNKKIKLLEKKARQEGLSQKESNQLRDLYNVSGMKYSRVKTVSIDNKLGGVPSNLEVKIKLKRKVYDKDSDMYVWQGAGSLNIFMENFSEVRELNSGKFGYEAGVKAILKYTGSNKEVGMPVLIKVKELIEDSYVGPVADKYRNEEKENEYFKEVNFIDSVLNKDVEGDFKQGANGIKLKIPSQDIRNRGMRKRAMNKLRKSLGSPKYDVSDLVA